MQPIITAQKMIARQRVFFIGALDEAGFPAIKAMLAPRKKEGVKTLWFSTNTATQHIAQYTADPRACVCFYKSLPYRALLLTGRMEILQEDAIRRELWRAGDTKYYPLGVTDPDYSVLKFTAERGRLFANPASYDFEIE